MFQILVYQWHAGETELGSMLLAMHTDGQLTVLSFPLNIETWKFETHKLNQKLND